jgi:DNA modification methylase
MGAADTLAGYADTPEIYFELLSTFVSSQDLFIDESAHLIFWLSFDFYEETKGLLREADWTVLDRPLIWHKTDNRGILPDPNRGPRWCYETALFASRGDRKIAQAVANIVGASTTKEYHMSEKPAAVLEHFFRLTVDETSRVLDPTAGSGMAIKVAEALGAPYSLGLEINGEFFERAKENLGL